MSRAIGGRLWLSSTGRCSCIPKLAVDGIDSFVLATCFPRGSAAATAALQHRPVPAPCTRRMRRRSSSSSSSSSSSKQSRQPFPCPQHNYPLYPFYSTRNYRFLVIFSPAVLLSVLHFLRNLTCVHVRFFPRHAASVVWCLGLARTFHTQK